MIRTLSVLVAGTGLLLSTGCGGGRAGGPAATSSARPAAVGSSEGLAAELEGAKITIAELDQRLKSELQQLDQQRYDLRRRALDDLLAEMLVKREAAARRISAEELLRQEVDARVKAPTPGELQALYARARGQLGGQPFDAVRPQLENFLRQRAREPVYAEFRRGLAKKQGVKVLLPVQRFDVVVAASAPSQGPQDAPVTIVEYTDYQCPFCQRAQETVETLLQRYPSKLRLVHRDFPLDMHPHARPAAAAAYCAGDQGRFWEYRRSLLVAAGDLGPADLEARAAGLKLDAAAFKTCLASQRYEDEIQKSFMEGQALGVNGTPAFFINGRFLNGAPPVEAFADVIEDELARSPKS